MTRVELNLVAKGGGVSAAVVVRSELRLRGYSVRLKIRGVPASRLTISHGQPHGRASYELHG